MDSVVVRLLRNPDFFLQPNEKKSFYNHVTIIVLRSKMIVLLLCPKQHCALAVLSLNIIINTYVILYRISFIKLALFHGRHISVSISNLFTFQLRYDIFLFHTMHAEAAKCKKGKEKNFHGSLREANFKNERKG